MAYGGCSDLVFIYKPAENDFVVFVGFKELVEAYLPFGSKCHLSTKSSSASRTLVKGRRARVLQRSRVGRTHKFSWW